MPPRERSSSARLAASTPKDSSTSAASPRIARCRTGSSAATRSSTARKSSTVNMRRRRRRDARSLCSPALKRFKRDPFISY
eukprot:scaffold51832_cov60-Phaeocystis_antarctica.AAC.2